LPILSSVTSVGPPVRDHELAEMGLDQLFDQLTPVHILPQRMNAESPGRIDCEVETDLGLLRSMSDG
jgi:hypothetical protein